MANVSKKSVTAKTSSTPVHEDTEQSSSQASQPQYTLTELLQHADELFGVKAEVLHGVFYDDSEKLFSVEEATQKIQQFMKEKVK
ncbi:hypothetical protein QE450_000451 [Paenibacillus sp. SORGH_AS306]|uniref:hypothetical protein n=1 Tax=unclassified Paenibacillus TaxID=185978 RepID=UPI002782AAD3|nr:MULTISPECIES: hypothetical protein [unclassified Paenibacillus]MDQ1232953.1 hypothetical protein [Paenibacillus sp. SORGH_AS_0306]MDR6109999.1 hypothetical protein [Paenibacillus sp. SORGH_AS_0338]